MSKRHDTALKTARKLRDQLAACALGGFADHAAASALVTALDAFLLSSGNGLTADETAMVRAGRKIDAIKSVRDRKNIGLRDALALVERGLQSPMRGHRLTYDEFAAWSAGNRIAAIKSVRARTGLGLAEAKALCELLGGGE